MFDEEVYTKINVSINGDEQDPLKIKVKMRSIFFFP